MRLVCHAIVACALAAVSAEICGQGTQRVPLQSAITRVQPMTGIVLWSDNEQVERLADAIALEYRYCGYDEVVQPDGAYDFRELDRVLDEIAGRNHQAVLRFYFVYKGKKTTAPDFIRERRDYDETVGKTEGEKTHYCDWRSRALQAFTLDFYTRFGERYDNDPRLAFLQVGFGIWGEYHIYDGPREMGKTFPSKAFQARFLRHLDQSFDDLPWSISVDAADYDYSPLEDNRRLLSLGFGLFDDSFLCRQHAEENAVNWRILGPDRWKRQPCGGEFSYYTRRDQRQALSKAGPNGESFERAAERFHISYMIGNDQPEHQPFDRIQAAGMATGYRFRATAAALRGDELRIRVVNEGVAPLYRDAYFAAGGKRSAESLRGLLPGEDLVCSILGVDKSDLQEITIASDAVLPGQTIEFAADLGR